MHTGKSFSEALIFASTNPQYDDRLFIELQVQFMKIPSSNLGRTCCVQNLFLTFITIFVHNMFSPCSTKRRASDKDLPLPDFQKIIQKNGSTCRIFHVVAVNEAFKSHSDLKESNVRDGLHICGSQWRPL